MKSTLLFSIIVPVYRVENYLAQCMQSLMNQTYDQIEIILVDDGSPDSCPELCDMYAKQDERVSVIHKKNGGLSTARNAGLAKAQGEYILFVDSDDNIALDTCERLLPYVQMGCDIVIGDGVAVGERKRLSHRNTAVGEVCPGIDYLKIAYKRKAMPMAVWLYVYKKSFLEEKRLCLKEGILHEDEQFIPRVFLEAKQVVESGICFYRYVIRENSITTCEDLRENAVDMFASCIELREIYAKIKDSELRDLMIDSLVVKYLSLFQQGKLYQYGKDYYHKKFIWTNAKFLKTRMKACLYCISPYFYWHLNHFTKTKNCRFAFIGEKENE